jgi:hypothetical protein
MRATGVVVVDVADIEKYVSPNNVSIMTCRQFNHYYFDVVDDALVDMDVDTPRHSLFNWGISSETTDVVHVEISQLGNNLLVNNMVSNAQLDTIGLTAGTIELYVIGNTPDDFIDCVSIDVAQLREGNIDARIVDYDLAAVTLLHRDPYLIVGKRLTHDTN